MKHNLVDYEACYLEHTTSQLEIIDRQTDGSLEVGEGGMKEDVGERLWLSVLIDLICAAADKSGHCSVGKTSSSRHEQHRSDPLLEYVRAKLGHFLLPIIAFPYGLWKT